MTPAPAEARGGRIIFTCAHLYQHRDHVLTFCGEVVVEGDLHGDPEHEPLTLLDAALLLVEAEREQ